MLTIGSSFVCAAAIAPGGRRKKVAGKFAKSLDREQLPADILTVYHKEMSDVNRNYV